MLLAGDTGEAETAASAPVRTAVYDGVYGYVRIGKISAGTEKEFTTAFRGLAATNKIKGWVFDLRFSGGEDYAAAAAMADVFFGGEKPLADWGEGVKKSTIKSDAIGVPVTFLVNRKTTGAAEALVGMIREGGVGLIIGANTAGQASIAKEFTLKTGQRLRIATRPIKLGEGKVFPLAGLKPDIQVDVNPDDERAYVEDAFKDVSKPARVASAGGASGAATNAAGTNRPPRHRLNEAELVRMLKEGQNPDADTNATVRDGAPVKPLLRDPALARAIDLLKGLAVVQQFRSI